MEHRVIIPEGYKLVPRQLTVEQLKAMLPYHYWIESVSQSKCIDYARAVEAAPEGSIVVDTESHAQLLNEVANWIEALPVVTGVTDGACAVLHKIEQALGTSGPDTHCARRIRRILNAQGATPC